MRNRSSVMARGRGVRVAAALATLAVLSGCAVPLPAGLAGLTASSDGSSSGVRYVSLGDSWVSGPLIADIVGDPIDCGRSSRNFPTLVARELGVERFTDASCGGAKIRDLTGFQKAPLGSRVRPQLDAVGADTTLVTIGVSGNDVKFSSAVISCANVVPIPLGPPPFGQPCVQTYTEGGVDVLAERIAATRPLMEEALAEIARRAPAATVLVVGYPSALPHEGGGCWPLLPLLEPDVRYLRDKYLQMNEMLAEAAAATGAVFVDTYGPSIGHDACQQVGVAWINGLTLDPVALPLHPNEYSHRATADVVLAKIAQLGTDRGNLSSERARRSVRR